MVAVDSHTWQVGAAPGDTDATYQPLAPCRLMDTRVDSNVGVRKAPIGPSETYSAQVTGSNGDCTGIPAGATGVAMNVTAVNPTAPSNLRIFPADLTDVPTVSNLNYANGSPPTPNKVDSKLSPDGKIKIFNAFGSVDVIVDIVGIYTNSSLVEIQNRLTALEARDTQLAAEIRDAIPVAVNQTADDVQITSDWSEVVSYTSINITRDGSVLAFASAGANESEAGADVQCVISNSSNPARFDTTDFNMIFEASGAVTGSTTGEGDAGNLSGTALFPVSAGSTGNYYLMCRNRQAVGVSQVWDPQITLLFIPNR